jgi:type VI secretion system protein ImpL
MLTEQDHLDVGWLTPMLTQDWQTFLRSDTSDSPPLEALVKKFLLLQKQGDVTPAVRANAVVEQTRALLRGMPRLLGDYADLMDRVRPSTTPIGRSTIFGGTSGDQFIFSKTGVSVDGVYTRAGWNKVRAELQTQADRLRGERWVLGDDEFDPDKLVAELRLLYFVRYTEAWNLFLRDLDVRKPLNVDEALPELLALTEPEWPYLRLIRTLQDNVTLDLTDEEAGKPKSVVDEAKALADRAKTLAPGDGGVSPAAPPRNVSLMERTFRPLIKFGVPPPPAKPDDPPAATALAQYEGSLRKLVAALTDHEQKGADARGEIKAVETEFQQAYQATLQLIADLDAPTRELIQDLLLKPITLSWSSVVHDAAGVSGALWEMSVYRACETRILGRFPFDPNATRDATVEDFADFFRPSTGVLWRFYDQNLKTAVQKRGDSYVPVQRFGQRNPYTATFLDFLSKSDAISSTMFQGDGKTPELTFSINLHSVSAEVSEVTFEIDGVSHTYKNTPEDWMSITWPAKDAKARGARVRVRGFSGLVEEIPRMGNFGLFRLLAVGNLQPGTAGGRPDEVRTLVATWTMQSQQATVRMDLRPSRSDNPFQKSFFSNYRCPSIITNGAR